jgi:hypothetical protein
MRYGRMIPYFMIHTEGDRYCDGDDISIHHCLHRQVPQFRVVSDFSKFSEEAITLCMVHDIGPSI